MEMVKIRLTYNRENIEEIEKTINIIESKFKILNKSKIYENRGKSLYNNIYIDVEIKEEN
jgi:hypothetical protein